MQSEAGVEERPPQQAPAAAAPPPPPPPAGESLPPVIVIRKKVHHDEHHGGAWKVAYADFVTAMMALFIVLWLLSSSEEVKKAVGGYFQDPTGTGKMAGSTLGATGEAALMDIQDLEHLKDRLERALKASPDFESLKQHVQITVTGEGLRIELLETDKGMFFESGSSKPSGGGAKVLMMLARELGHLPNDVVIEGHTDSKPYSIVGEYSNWELSSDRANAARRLMEETGLRAGQVDQVRGFASRRLRLPAEPLDASNRRVSVIAKFHAPPPSRAKENKGPNGRKGQH